jgi:glycosyltransferase involved in cell wall biosynthesis
VVSTPYFDDFGRCSFILRYVSRPKPEVFRITKNNHNILQGVADPNERLTAEKKHTVNAWCEDNAKYFWLQTGGPLRKGGADIIVVDDPQMPGIVQIAKEQDPDRPVIFRSHIQIRSDLAVQEGTPTAEVWNWLWEKVQCADIFISHPVREFVPKDVDMRKVGYMPAATDWLDGLNKGLTDYDSRYYLHLFNEECQRTNVPQLAYPARPYIVQIARFDPSKGIPVVLAAYAELRRKYMHDCAKELIPQLVLAGHGSVDDPDASRVYDETMQLLSTEYSDVRDDVIPMRIGPIDQILNALLTHAYVATQLSTREGFEIKVSEALHHGVPIVASKAGGIPLQVVDGKNGFLVNAGEHKDAAKYLHLLFTSDATYKRMRKYAASSVSDEVSTVGNALNWMFLASKMLSGNTVEPKGKWIYDMARDDIGLPIQVDEIQLPRIRD